MLQVPFGHLCSSHRYANQRMVPLTRLVLLLNLEARKSTSIQIAKCTWNTMEETS